ncbi:MAG: metalloregulator ArsR/SmtB family transcription factor [Actinomycetota bacterium]
MSSFAVLAEPNRRRILDALRPGPQTVNGLVEQLGIRQPSVSKHLKVLRDADLVEVRAEGKKRWYSINAAPLAELAEWLEPYRAFWSDRLDALEAHLDVHPTISPREEAP